MKNYLLTAAGVIFLSVMVSLLLPEGKLNKSITFVMRLICILVLVQPLTGLFGIKTQIASKDAVDYAYVAQVYTNNQSAQLEKLLKEKFGAETECTVKVEYEEGQFKVKEAVVAIAENNNNLNEDIYEYLKELGYINITVYAEST